MQEEAGLLLMPVYAVSVAHLGKYGVMAAWVCALLQGPHPPTSTLETKWLHGNFCLRQARDKTGLLTSAPSAVSGAILLVIGSRELKISIQHDSCIYCADIFSPFPMPMTRYDKIGGFACFSSSAA